MLFPQTRSQLSDSTGGVKADPLQHIDQVGIGVDTMQAARDDQTLHDADMLGTEPPLMFDPTVCCQVCLAASPAVRCEGLLELKRLLTGAYLASDKGVLQADPWLAKELMGKL